MSKIVDLVTDFLQPYAEMCNVEIVEVEYKKLNNGNNLTIFIDKENGVDIEDCVKLHRMIDEPLDKLDPTNGQSYILNVSSCGIDRPFKKMRDYIRAIGKNISVKFYEPYNGNKSLQGILKDVTEQYIVLAISDKEEKIDMQIIASANIIFEDKGEYDAK